MKGKKPAVADGAAKLAAYFDAVGFKSIRSATHQFIGHWNGRRQPSIKDVCPHLFTH